MYETTDKAISQINKTIQHEFTRLRRTALAFDEVHIIERTVNECYNTILLACERVYLDLARKIYKETTDVDYLFTLWWLDKFLQRYDPVTKYVFSHEFDRKRARTFEAIVASKKSDIQKEIKQAMYSLSVQTTQYADEITDFAVLKGYEDAGIDRVRWVTEQDNRVCHTCQERDGKTYDVHKVPIKPHIRCRCYLLPATKHNSK